MLHLLLIYNKALAFIMLHVKQHHLAMLDMCVSAKQAWEQLEATYKAKSSARRLQLHRDLTGIRKDPAEPLTT